MLLDFINRHFWKSVANPIAAFLMVPALSLFFLYINGRYAATTMPTVVIVPLSMVPSGVLAPMVLDVKRNSLIERVFVFSRKPAHANVIVAGYGLVLTLAAFIWTFFVVFLASLDRATFPDGLFNGVDWGAFVFTALIGSLEMLGVAALIYTFINSRVWMNIVVLLTQLFFIGLSGSFVSIAVMASTPGLNYVSYFSPARYIAASFVVAMNAGAGPTNVNGVGIFDFGSDFLTATTSPDDGQITQTALLHSYDLALDVFVPLIIAAASLGFCLNVRLCRKK